MALVCRWCGASDFPSRTKLFAHIRGTVSCAAAAAAEDERAPEVLAAGAKRTVAVFRIGYSCDGALAEERFAEILRGAGAFKLVTQRATAGSIGPLQRQERCCPAVGDVFAASFTSALLADVFLERARDALHEAETSSKADRGHEMRLFKAALLRNESNRDFKVEALCTQRSYAYLLPLSAMLAKGGNADAGAGLPRDLTPVREDQCMSGSTRPVAWVEDDERKALYRSLKKAIRAALQVEQAGSKTEDQQEKCQASHKVAKRVPWHNFAPQNLAGNLDPQSAAVQGTLVKFFHADTVTLNGEEYAVLRISGDRFLPEQCRRLVATALCLQRGLLPEDFFQTATRQDVIVNTPLAPAHLLYFDECRFMYWEQRNGELFGPEDTPDPALATWRRRIWEAMVEQGASGHQGVARWLEELEQFEVPRIRTQLAQVAAADAFARGAWQAARPIPPADDFPPVYEECLQLLREADRSGLWPENSRARAMVIRGGGGGTFSVGHTVEGQHQPRGNGLFPRLTEAVFELERLISPASRTPSTMVAINRNAQFALHIDSGAGLGQTTSLIVGLGAYVGGELAVESELHDVRYKPLEFDGWKQRHWTLPFAGERFSLVWFTPATKQP